MDISNLALRCCYGRCCVFYDDTLLSGNMSNFKRIAFVVFVLLFSLGSDAAFAQCAMCRVTLENNVNNGVMVASGLNFGILYLLSMPYLAISIIAFLWYKNSKKNRENKRNYSRMAG